MSEDDKHERLGTAATVEDPEDYIGMTRRQEIQAAKEDVRETHRELELRKADPSVHVPPASYTLALRAAVEDFLIAIEPLAKIEAEAEAKPYWEDKDLGAVTLHPPKGFSGCAPVQYSLSGLGDLLDAPEVFEHTFTATVSSRHGGKQVRSKTVSEPIPKHVLQRALRLGGQFLAEIGMEVEVSTTERAAEYTQEMHEEVAARINALKSQPDGPEVTASGDD